MFFITKNCACISDSGKAEYRNKGRSHEGMFKFRLLDDDGELISDKPILYFYAPDITSSSWHESLNHAVTIEGHKFFYLDEDVNADWFLNLRKDV